MQKMIFYSYIWEFSYGTNINDDVFINKKHIKPYDVKQGYIEDWKLCFDKSGFPFIDPVFSNI